MPGESVQSVVDELAHRLGRAVVVDDAGLRPVAYTVQTGTVDQRRVDTILQRRVDDRSRAFLSGLRIGDAVGHVRVPPSEELQSLARHCFPLRVQESLLGYLWVIDDPPLATAEISLCASVAGVVAELLALDLTRDDRRAEEARRGLLGLLSGGARAVESASALLTAGWLRRGGPFHLAVVTFAPSTTDAGGAARRFETELRSTTRPLSVVSAMRTDDLVLVLDDTAPRRSGVPVDDVLRAAARRLRPLSATVGVAAPAPTLPDAGSQLTNARFAGRVAARIPSFGGLARWDRLGEYAAWQGVHVDGALLERLQPGVLALLEPAHALYAETLRTYLDLGGDAAAAAEELVVHRSTLYWRLSRIADRLGADLGDGAVRLRLHMALRLAPLRDDARPSPSRDD